MTAWLREPSTQPRWVIFCLWICMQYVLVSGFGWWALVAQAGAWVVLFAFAWVYEWDRDRQKA